MSGDVILLHAAASLLSKLTHTSLYGSAEGGGQIGGGAGCLRLTYWILIFSASQLGLCLLPDINSLKLVSALGAATTLGFSALATVGAALHGEAGARVVFDLCAREAAVRCLRTAVFGEY
jgi:hypothetical protein